MEPPVPDHLNNKLAEENLSRMEFIQDYTLKSLRLKPDKWNKLIISDEQRTFLTNFIERGMGWRPQKYLEYLQTCPRTVRGEGVTPCPKRK